MKQEEKLGLLLAAATNLTVRIRLDAQSGAIKLTAELRKMLIETETIILGVAK